MGRRKSVRQLQRDLAFATAKEAYVPPARPAGGTPRRRPKNAYSYNSYLGLQTYMVQATASSVTKFGGAAALGLEAAGDSGAAPRGFKPAMVNLMEGDATPTYVRARGSGRSYIRYAAGAVGGTTQSTFSAPISDNGAPATVTIADVKARFELVSAARRADAGAYGRIWMTWEHFPLATSGTAPAG